MKHAGIILTIFTARLAAETVIEPMVVTASRIEQESQRTPYSVRESNASIFQESQRRSLPESLLYVPGVLVQKTTHGHGSPFIRGFTGRQNLLLVDGVRINNSTFRSGPIQYWNTIDLLAVERTELILSQGSVLYGPDAIGGTLNALTKGSQFFLKPEGKFFNEGALYYEARSNGQGSHVARLELDAGVGESFGIFLGLSAKNFGDIDAPRIGRMKGTGYDESAFDLKIDWAVTPDMQLTLAHQQVDQDGISRWHRTTANSGWKDGSHVTTPGLWNRDDFDQERALTYLKIKGENPHAEAMVDRWTATLSWQKTADSESIDRRPARAETANDALQKSNIDLSTIGFDLSLESDFGEVTAVYGIDFYDDRVDASGHRSNAMGGPKNESLPIADDSNYQLGGIFGQTIWRPSEDWEVTAGVRYTHAEASLGRYVDAAGIEQRNTTDAWDSWVGSIRALYAIDASWTVFGGISQAFRAPNLVDLSGNAVSRAGAITLGNIDLDPETYLTWEMGIKYASDTIKCNLSIFHSVAEGVIQSIFTDGTLKTSTATNSADGYVHGIEWDGSWQFHPQWQVSAFAAWQDGESDAPAFIGGPMVTRSNARLLPLSGSIALRWAHPSDRLWIEGRVLAAAKEDRTDPLDQAADSQRIPTNGTPGYVTASLRAGWKMGENIEAVAGIENINNQSYRIHGSGQNEPGIHGIFNIRMAW